jgi:hypothetical protein
MAITLTEIRTKIIETEAAISRVKSAQSYAKGDKSLQRAQMMDLQAELVSLRRDESRLEAKAKGATNSGIMTASWYST